MLSEGGEQVTAKIWGDWGLTGIQKTGAFLVAAALLVACGASVWAKPKHRETRHEAAVSIDDSVRSTIASVDTSDANSRVALLDAARVELEMEETLAKHEVQGNEPHAVSDAVSAAQARILVADEEIKIGCPTIGKADLLTVIDTYVGSGYAAPRQRAGIAIDDLRSAPHAEDAAFCKKIGGASG